MVFLPPPLLPHTRHPTPPRTSPTYPKCSAYDTILIGTGLSTLSTAALLHTYDPNHRSLILESHTTPGGAAHTFRRRCPDGWLTFESGPHLFSGLAPGADNPVGQLFQACGIDPGVIPYDTWGVFLGDDYTPTKVPGEPLLGELLNPQGRAEMRALTDALKPYGEAAKALSVACVRPDWQFLRLLAPRAKNLLPHLRAVPGLSQPFDKMLRTYVKDPLAYALVDMLCFLLAGVTATRIPTAEVAFMFSEWNGRTSSVLQRPVGGAMGIVDGLLGHIRSHGGVIRTNTSVERVLTDTASGCVIGVELASGETISCPRVVSGVSALDLDRLLGQPGHTGTEDVCDSFLHLHVGVKLTDEVLRHVAGGRLEANYVVVDDILGDIEAPGNVVLISIPSVIDDTAPAGWATIHAYTPATEPWESWSGLTEGTDEYEAHKRERGEVVWRAVNRVFGCELREHAEIGLVGTPRTHSRFLRRARGSYGGKVDARKLGLGLPGGRGVDGLVVVGDGVFPGVGVPAVVGSAWIAANGCVDVGRQEVLLRDLGL